MLGGLGVGGEVVVGGGFWVRRDGEEVVVDLEAELQGEGHEADFWC